MIVSVLDELALAQVVFRRAAAQAEEMRLERNRVVAQALLHGHTHAQIAAVIGVSRGRVGQLALDVERFGG